MATKKVSVLAEATSVNVDDVVYAVINPASVPVSKRVTAQNLVHSIPTAKLTEQAADPSTPAEGSAISWMSDGTGTGSDGEVLLHVTAGGVSTLYKQSSVIAASGDATGATDAAAIQAALDRTGTAVLGPGLFTVNGQINLNAIRQSVIGQGNLTRITTTDNLEPVFRVSMAQCTIKDMLVYGGLYNLHIGGDGAGVDASRCVIDNVHCSLAQSHGIYFNGSGNVHRIVNSSVSSSGEGGSGNGIHMVAVDQANNSNGNGSTIVGVDVTDCAGYGIKITSRGFNVIGCHISANDSGGILLESTTGSNCYGGLIQGNYMEANTGPGITLKTTDAADVVAGVEITGNNISNATTIDCVKFDANTADKIVRVHITPSNYFTGPDNATGFIVNMGSGGNRCHINVDDPDSVSVSNDKNVITNSYFPGLPVRSFADTNAPNNVLYYSTTQSSLAYKNSGGTVTTIDQTAT